MADGKLCKHCGHQETDHLLEDFAPNPNKRKEGFRVSLHSCSGFVLRKADQQAGPKRKDVDSLLLEWLERRAGERAAWGRFGVWARNERLNANICSHDRRISSASTTEEKVKATLAKQHYIDACHGDNSIAIG